MRTLRREAPVGTEAGNKEFGLHILHGAREVVAVICGRVEVVKRLGHQQISVGIKAADKLVALIAKIRFHFKFNTVAVLITV